MIKKILIATHNPAKLEEIKLGLEELEKYKIQLISLNDVRVENSPEETGKTFKENALLKAKFYSNLTQLPTISDDGGLIIPYLDNEPGVKSRRWLGYDASDEELISYTLKRLKNTTKKQRTAYLQTCLCFYLPKKTSSKILSLTRSHQKQNKKNKDFLILQEEKIKGYIAFSSSKKRIKGYPFRALFIVEKYNKYYDELTDEEHQKINHRLTALKKIVKKIKEKLEIEN
ncbi:MAG: hypothetical protein N2593_01070 [Patescibacteria group bacterium]|nr:hypothetical protein [Patescibacteria group bacterium]